MGEHLIVLKSTNIHSKPQGGLDFRVTTHPTEVNTLERRRWRRVAPGDEAMGGPLSEWAGPSYSQPMETKQLRGGVWGKWGGGEEGGACVARVTRSLVVLSSSCVQMSISCAETHKLW